MKYSDIRKELDKIYSHNELSTYLNDFLVDLDDFIDSLKECSNCEVAPGKKCHTCKFNTISKSTREDDYWREHLGEGDA